jgi:glycerol-3-phosphate dehydrogenase (NAD(P)+)
MLKAAVLGAGYMGSAITYPLADNGIETNLWGTWLDDSIIDSCLAGYHPKLKKPLQDGVHPMYSKNLKQAAIDVDIIFIAVASEGFVPVFKMLLETIDRNYYFFKLTKGLVSYNDSIVRASQAAYDIFKKKFGNEEFLWATVGGPVRALDLAYKTISASMFGISTKKIKKILSKISTEYYRTFSSDDLAGVEICSTFKNIYSIAPGICDGLFKVSKDGLYYNLVAFLFNQASIEISKVAQAAGGKKETAFNLAGIGDLHVTAAAGRNRRYGEMIGKGIDPTRAFKKMYDEGEYGEGYVALNLAFPWLSNFNINIKNELPLLDFLYSIIFKKADPCQELIKFAKGLGF